MDLPLRVLLCFERLFPLDISVMLLRLKFECLFGKRDFPSHCQFELKVHISLHTSVLTVIPARLYDVLDYCRLQNLSGVEVWGSP